MKYNLTEIVFIIDRSGSMHFLTEDTIGGFNAFIEKQKTLEGEAIVTTVLFDEEYELLHNGINLKEIKPLTNNDYYSRGSTALYDAIGKTINTVGARLGNTDESERPSKVIFVITTDGYENASLEFTKQQVKEMIEHQRTKYSWEFIFLGANIDSAEESASLGMNSNYSKNYTYSHAGGQSVYSTVCNTVSMLRSCNWESQEAKEVAIADSLNDIQ